MFGGLSGLSLVQKIYLESSMLSAIFLPILLLNLIDDALATTLLYQAICLIAFPALYIKYLSKEKDLAPYFLSEFRNKGKQFMVGLTGMTIALIIVLCSYLLIYELSYLSIILAHIPISLNRFYLIFLLVALVLANPVLEEWYWRLFLSKTLENSPKMLDFINIHYGIFHTYIIFHVIGLKSAIMFTLTYLSFGRSMQFMKEKYGYISCIMTHLGLAMGMVLCFCDAIYNQEETGVLIK